VQGGWEMGSLLLDWAGDCAHAFPAGAGSALLAWKEPDLFCRCMVWACCYSLYKLRGKTTARERRKTWNWKSVHCRCLWEAGLWGFTFSLDVPFTMWYAFLCLPYAAAFYQGVTYHVYRCEDCLLLHLSTLCNSMPWAPYIPGEPVVSFCSLCLHFLHLHCMPLVMLP